MEAKIRFDELRLALEEFANRHGVDPDRVESVLEEALRRTFKHKYRYAHPKPDVETHVDLKRGDIKIVLKYPEGEKKSEIIQLTDFTVDDVHTLKNFFVQLIKYDIQKADLAKLMPYKGKIVSGRIQKVDRKKGLLVGVTLDDISVQGRVEPSGMVKGEVYRAGQEIEAVVLGIEERSAYPLVLSRAHPDYLKALLERIPEVSDGTVQIRVIAREAGVMSKVAVSSVDPFVNPVTSLLGRKGIRIREISKRLPKDESVEVVEYDSDRVRFTVLALAPAKGAVAAYETENDVKVYYEDEDNLAKAKGKEGLNVILASRLVGKRITVLHISEYEPPKEGVTLYDIKDRLQPPIYEKMKGAALVYFKKLIPLVHVQRLLDVDEATAIRVLDIVEEALKEKAEKTKQEVMDD